MRPVLFRLRGVTIRSYPAMLYVGLDAGLVAGNAAAHAAGMDAFRVLVVSLILLVPSLIGARLLYVASHWRIYRQNPELIWNRNQGGAAQYGGLALALPLSFPLAGAFRLSWGGFWDASVFTILVGMIFGRIGCLLNGCCAGRPSRSRLAVDLPNVEGVWARRLPTQCMEAIWAAGLLALAIEIRPRLLSPGALFWIVVAGYAAGRLVLESTRESRPGTRRFTIHHGLSAALILISATALAFGWLKPWRG